LLVHELFLVTSWYDFSIGVIKSKKPCMPTGAMIRLVIRIAFPMPGSIAIHHIFTFKTVL